MGPLAGLRVQSADYYTLTLLLVGLGLGGAILGAGRFSRAVAEPLENVVSLVRNVSVQNDAVEFTPPTATVAEIQQLAEDVQHMQRRLADSYGRLEQALAQKVQLNAELEALTADLDQKVRERTAELSEATRVAREGRS
jgi:nitrate/nitrite-specific signal transduction histidine kinase